jgi:hypothetical protein
MQTSNNWTHNNYEIKRENKIFTMQKKKELNCGLLF